MQGAQSSEGVNSPSGSPPTRSVFLSPVVIGLAVLVAVGGLALYVFSRPEEAARPSGTQNTETSPSENSFALTNEEAIEKFDELHQLALRSARQRDPTLLRHVFTANGPIAIRARDSIGDLLKQQVVDRSEVETLNVEVLENGPDQVTLLEVSRLYPCFVAESGKNVTQGPTAIRQEILWTLKLEESQWLIEDAVLRTDRAIKGHFVGC